MSSTVYTPTCANYYYYYPGTTTTTTCMKRAKCKSVNKTETES